MAFNTREYRVGWSTKTSTKKIVEYFVSDALDDAELDTRPNVAVFPVTQLYDEHSQKQRAQMYADYMNKIQEATQKAYEQTLLIDILKK